MSGELGVLHAGFAKLTPLIRFAYERLGRQRWFDEIVPGVWLGGAPAYERDHRTLALHGIRAVLDMRRERGGDVERYARAGVAYLRLPVLDAMVPSAGALDAGTAFVHEHVLAGRAVLVHCAKGRGRAATVVAAYLMRYRGMTRAQAEAVLGEKRPLVSIRARHRRRLESWATRKEDTRGE